MAREGRLPPADAYSLYSDDAEKGIFAQRQFQKTIREFRSPDNVRLSLHYPSGQISEVDPGDVTNRERNVSNCRNGFDSCEHR